MEVTAGKLLGGRVRYAQPCDGYRTGIEPVLLAAAVPAEPGALVIEAGTGAGAGLLCLTRRVPGARGLGIELDTGMAALARENAAANGFDQLTIVTGDVTAITLPRVEHAMANPPWHRPASTASPLARRRLAKQERVHGVEAWIAALGGALAGGGSLTLILPPALVPRSVEAFERAGLGGASQLALLPKAGRAAKLVLLQAWHGRHGDGGHGSFVLHGEDGAYTPAAEAVLRHGAALKPA